VGVTRGTAWQRWGRTASLGAVAIAAAAIAFVADTPVPLLDWFDLAMHETGHLLAFPLPEIVMFMAGSFAQVAFPLVMAWYFGYRFRDRAAGGLCLVWAGTSAWDVSVYAADAVAQQLPLIGGGQHDWAYILDRFDALHLTPAVARGIELGGAVLAVVGLCVIALALRERPLIRFERIVEVAPEKSVPEVDPWIVAGRLPFRHEPAPR
jgi:hypothetical protein